MTTQNMPGGRRFCTFRFRKFAASVSAFACAGLCFAQQFVTLDAALANSLAYLQSKIPKGNKIMDASNISWFAYNQ